MKNKNRHILISFIKYCEKHPEQRFWQALRNWSGANFILKSGVLIQSPWSVDTFYFKGKNK